MYYHFPKGKEELALESVKLAGEMIIKNLINQLDMFESPIDGIVANFNDMAQIIDDYNKMKDMSISLIALETYKSSEVLRQACEEVFETIENIYTERLIKYGIEKQKAKDIAITILSITEGAIVCSVTKKSGESLRIVAKQVKVLVHN